MFYIILSYTCISRNGLLMIDLYKFIFIIKYFKCITSIVKISVKKLLRLPGKCFPDTPIDILTRDSGAWMNVFLDLKFTCEGEVLGYQFYASNTGS